VGSPENISAIAEMTTDYPDLPVVSYMPNLSWWQDGLIDQYLDAFRELLLPQTTRCWLETTAPCGAGCCPTGTATAARVRATSPRRSRDGRALHAGHRHSSARAVHRKHPGIARVRAVVSRFELFDATFAGAGDTLSAALAALVASGTDLGEACSEALGYLDRCLDGGFRPGMGHVIPDRMFWAEPEDSDDDTPDDTNPPSLAIGRLRIAPHDIKH
jgi:hydroxymethylpyrimidine/phosphomethylpyrimidine kinase